MGDYDSNYNYICCPYCGEDISKNKESDYWVSDLEDEDDDFFQCHSCEKFFKAELYINKEYQYEIRKPTDEEIKKLGLLANLDPGIVIDVPGQTFMWENLFANES